MYLADVLGEAIAPRSRRVVAEPSLERTGAAVYRAHTAHVQRVPLAVLVPTPPLTDSLGPISPLLRPLGPPQPRRRCCRRCLCSLSLPNSLVVFYQLAGELPEELEAAIFPASPLHSSQF
jgi:hypothetical protein